MSTALLVPRTLRLPAASLPEASVLALMGAAESVAAPPPLPPTTSSRDPLDAWSREARARFKPFLEAAAASNQLPVRLLEAVIAVESGFNPNARSHQGALGLMQLMPLTARSLGVRDAFDPAESIQGGARYLRHLLDRFDGDLTLALAAYNAGPTNVRRAGGIPARRETINYVKRVHRLLAAGPKRRIAVEPVS